MRVAVYGTGGFGREALAWWRDMSPDEEFVGFLDDDDAKWGRETSSGTVLGGADWLDGSNADAVVLGVGSPRARKHVLDRLNALNIPVVTVVHPSASVGPRNELGPGSVVCPGARITVDVSVGAGSVLNLNATVGHDARLGECCVLAPGVDLAGNVTLGKGVDIGINATVIQGLEIGEWSVVGAGAAVVRSIPPRVTAVGVPAKVISEHTR